MTIVSMLVVFYIFTVASYELRLIDFDFDMFPKLLDWIALIVLYSLVYAVLLWLFPMRALAPITAICAPFRRV